LTPAASQNTTESTHSEFKRGNKDVDQRTAAGFDGLPLGHPRQCDRARQGEAREQFAGRGPPTAAAPIPLILFHDAVLRLVEVEAGTSAGTATAGRAAERLWGVLRVAVAMLRKLPAALSGRRS
jgi:hypothetical protein